jgi:class 3 adenylate cyclase
MANGLEVKKEEDQPGKALPAIWVLGTVIIIGAVSWFYTQSLEAAFACGVASAALLVLVARAFWWRAQESLLVELQSFLLRCRVLPQDYKIVRKSTPVAIGATKKEIMDLAYAHFSGTEKRLVESLHILDKFVGTRASQFATAKGNKAVWEGEVTSCIVLVSDVRGFTAMTEKLRPQETVRYLNRMFTELEEIITFSGGEINKFMGDSILAFYPFPPDKEAESIQKALLSALQMQDGFHQILGAFKGNYSKDVETGLGIGLAAGNVIMGNLGSARRMEFTVIGDTVNFAARLCALAKDGQILINRDMAHSAADDFRLDELPPVMIKGKTGMHSPYVVLGKKIQAGLA